jgi:adenylate kinase
MKRFISWLFFLPFTLFAIQPNLILYGRPGAGKGTFSQHMKHTYGYEHVSSGDLIRREIDLQTPIGKEVEDVVRRGEFIRQDIIHSLMRHCVIEFYQAGKPFIIDGFARSEASVEFLHRLIDELNLHSHVLVVYLDATDATCAARIRSRLICSECGYVYNTISYVPQKEGACNFCKGALKGRLNDEAEIILKRLADYRKTIENVVLGAKAGFPYIEFNTEQPLADCLNSYDLFMKELLQENTLALCK